MIIISHRGYWIDKSEKNTSLSFNRSFRLGFGTETDLRDFNGNLVISHDIPNENAILIDDFFKLYTSQSNSLLALNIKSDGLQSILKNKLEEFSIQNYFVFDMSVPDTLGYINNGTRFFSRQSEYEMMPIFYDQADGIWLDSFNKEWFDLELIINHIKNGKKVAIVSSELHGRDQMGLWNFLKTSNLYKEEKLILCSDFPELASNFFNK
jgi:hypothetical protein